ncbi:double-strand break repair helicase AddA [Roseococcus sp. SDR]|uniref:double-strand break repair helicase AddA n=1 Tax=Roseococcus sp. SDR TaxID=2835532 RepID=UPI001BCAE78F|nr:double-strand break repair helicase AddA [Roseococcus sp. SDR]MBS7790196.1 double-strand break repair helicase AddA [Roseococcus sp. SDR]MBV1845510.1 double-strand break repair helicase AddA [Roseococcus sp. SDR]
MTSPRDIAQASQSRASDPAVSAFVTASAGSGKTKLLTDRLLRLMLGGARPERLLCLTFTKAAAAEMATRLNARLGRWAVATPADLDAELRALLGKPPTGEEIARARAGFAAVLELPGGMRIATLHSFAQSLLRGFALEAGLPPGFAVLEELDANAQLAGAREAELPQSPALERLAALSNAAGLGQVMSELRHSEPMLQAGLGALGGLPMLVAEIAQRLGLDPEADEGELLREAATPADERALARAAARLVLGGKADGKLGTPMKAWLALDQVAREAALDDWTRVFITTEGTIRKSFASKATGDEQAFIQAVCEREGERLLEARARGEALALLRSTEAALVLGIPVLRRFAAAKQRMGRLDYDDLIQAARKLLDDPGAAWVLFKLDGGLDHILLDEAQDSNPEQWAIARALSGEFFAGRGTHANEAPRTVFAVGDIKQSIYGFQGADAGGLPRAEAEFRAAVTAAGQEFRAVPLEVSFRSAPPVLALVDAVFAEGPAREGVVAPGQTLRHLPDRAGAAGMVELWPLQSQAKAEDPPAWAVPEAPMAETGADARLAATLAARIAHMIAHGRLDSRCEADPAEGRPIRARDILVLVRRRNAFLGLLVRALKERGVPVGGVDRMVLVEQIAVQDVLATLDAILLPQDELQLAAALKSPIFGLEEEDLFTLAWNRPGTLHARLMAERGADTAIGRAADLFAALTARADHLPAHALIAEILGERGGRARLLARLGPDAADPLDELLTAAMAHERAHPASLQGFLHWLRRSSATVKREADASADMVRVMTVHGAKGLEAPIVILPDTAAIPPQKSGLRWTPEDLPLWAPRRTGFNAPAYAEAEARQAALEAEEANRLLYVALTRAEDRLIICGWHGSKGPAPGCWYEKIKAGFARLEGVVERDFDPTAWGGDADGFAPGPVLSLASPQTDPRRAEPRRAAGAAALALPAWARIPATAIATPGVATPSHMEDQEAEVPAAAPHAPGDPLGRRFRRGNLIHALLQSLPELPPEAREPAGRAFLARPGHGLDAIQQAEILAEALGVMAHPAIAAAFAPGSLAEAPLAGRVGERLILGQVDRLLITPDRITLLDFKSNRPPPTLAEAAPPAYLRQMAAYRAVLRLAFPGRPVDCSLVWTYGAQVMPLPDALLDAHAPAPGDGSGAA